VLKRIFSHCIALFGASALPLRHAAYGSSFLLIVVMPAIVATGVDAAPLRVSVTDARNAPLAEAVVTLRATAKAVLRDGATVSAPAPSRAALSVGAQPVVIKQVDREFVPRVTLVPLGSRVSLPNNDAVPHSVYSFSTAKQFEFDAYVGSAPQVLTLDKVGVITLGCNIHDWMIGYIVVVDTPLAQKTDAKGIAQFANLPDGDYELKVWHPQQRAGDHVAQIVSGEQIRSLMVVLDVTPPRARYKPPLTIKQY
jgi:plastocyanin